MHDRSIVLAATADAAVHYQISHSTLQAREQRSTLGSFSEVDGQCMTLSVKDTSVPVVVIKDKCAVCFQCHVACELHIIEGTACYAVVSFGQPEVLCRAEQELVALFIARHKGVVEVATVGANAELVYLMLGALGTAGCVAIGHLGAGSHMSVTVSGSAGIYLLAASEGRGQWIVVLAHCLGPHNLALVVVELIAGTTLLDVILGDDGYALGVIPLRGGQVAIGGTARTLSLGILGQVNHLQIARVAADGSASAQVAHAGLIDEQAVLHGGVVA